MKEQKSFTLIETLVYIALFAILMGGAVVVAYTVFESAGRNQAKQILQQEGDFLIGKIEWVLSGVQTIASPPLDPLNPTAPIQSSILQIARYDGSSRTINTSEDCSGMTPTSNIFLQKGTSCSQLNNSNVQINDLVFTRNPGEGINPESVSASFTLTARTENGMLINQDFSTTKYLRK
ncbi:MAG: type II secretion system protein [Candidatus Nealsonbacteria bacterium]|nr:type II secretion system protein [Candidatus Nealsonbacteria bacterium]